MEDITEKQQDGPVDQEGQIHLDEYFPNALELLYRGKKASLYLCDPGAVETTKIPNEAVSYADVPVIGETVIPDALEALLEQERLGALVIRRYHELPEKMLEWICNAEVGVIREDNLVNTPGPKADYYKEHYPQSWEIVVQGQKDE